MSKDESVVIIIGKMMLISVIAAALLGVTYGPTQEQLKINYDLAQKEALLKIVPEAADFESVYGDQVINEEGDLEILYYRGVDASGNTVGYAFFRDQVGSQGMIQVAGGVDAKFTRITGITIMKHSETPGLGALIVDPEFTNQFTDVGMENLMLTGDGGKINAITGATISSQAVVDALRGQVDDLKKQV